MSSWNFIVYYSYRLHTFLIHPETSYDELVNIIRARWKFSMDHHLLEIYDVRFRTYILLDDEYIRNLQNRLPKTSVSTLTGRIRRRRRLTISQQSNSREYQQLLSSPSETNRLITGLDVSIKQRANATTRVDIARSMSVHETSIDDLIQTNTQTTNSNQHFMTFSNQEECLNFLERVESSMKILFIISNLSNNQQIVSLLTKRVRMVYVLDTHILFPMDWISDKQASLVIFDNDHDRLVQLIHNLARRFLDNATSGVQTMVFLKWARKLFHRVMENDSSSECDIFLQSIDQQLEKLEVEQREKIENIALECNEN